MLDEGRLNLGGGETVARDVDDIVNTAADPDVPVVISACAISGEVVALVGTHVGLEISSVVAVDGSGNGGPWGSNGQNTLDVIAFQFFAALRVKQDWIDAEERQGGRTWLCPSRAGKRSDDDRAGLGLPVCVDDSALFLTDMLVVPIPGFGVDGFAYGTDGP